MRKFLLLAIVAVAYVLAEGYEDTPTPATPPPPTQAEPTTKKPVPPCPPVENCHKEPDCGPCHTLAIKQKRDGKTVCCNTYKCKPKRCQNKKPKCKPTQRLIIEEAASKTNCCPKWKCVDKCKKEQCKCGHQAKCADGAAPVVVTKANPAKGQCCAVYKCKNNCKKQKCKKPKCADGEVPHLVKGKVNNPLSPCCPKYECKKQCQCTKIKECPKNWKKVPDAARTKACRCKLEKCIPPPCYKHKCEKTPKKCPKGSYLKVKKSPGANGEKPCCCEFECVKKECSKKVCKSRKCGPYKKQVVTPPKEGECCAKVTCKPICPKNPPKPKPTCKPSQVRVVVKAAHSGGIGKPCFHEYKCKDKCCKKGCPEKPKCPKGWKLESRKDAKPFDCCKIYTCKPPKCPKCPKSTSCKKKQITQTVGLDSTGCCLKKKCVKKCDLIRCPKVSCPKGWSKKITKATGSRCCEKVKCTHPCDKARCKQVRCKRGTYPVVTKQPGFDAKQEKHFCCPTIECKPVDPCEDVKCPAHKCADGWKQVVHQKADPVKGRCCNVYKCKAPCCKTSSKCADVAKAVKACKKKGGRAVLVKASNFPQKPCCPEVKCEGPCEKKDYCKPLACPKGYQAKVVTLKPAKTDGFAPCCPEQRCIPVCADKKCPKKPKCGKYEERVLVEGSDGPHGPRCCPTYECKNKCRTKCCKDVKCPKGWEKKKTASADKSKGKCCCEYKCVAPCAGVKCKKPKCEFGKAILVKNSNAPNKPCCAEYRCPGKCEKGGCPKNGQLKSCPKLNKCKSWETTKIGPSENGCCPKVTCVGPCDRAKKPKRVKCGKDEIRVRVNHGLKPKNRPCYCRYKCVKKCTLAKCEKCEKPCAEGYIKKTVAKKNPEKGVCCDVVRCVPECANKKCKPSCKEGEAPVFTGSGKDSLLPCKKYGCCPKYKCVVKKCRRERCSVPTCPKGQYPTYDKKGECCDTFKCQGGEQYGARAADHLCPGYSCPAGHKPVLSAGTFLWKTLGFCPQISCKKPSDDYLTSKLLNDYENYE